MVITLVLLSLLIIVATKLVTIKRAQFSMSQINFLPKTDLLYIKDKHTLGFINADGTSSDTIQVELYYDEDDFLYQAAFRGGTIVFTSGPASGSSTYRPSLYVWEFNEDLYKLCSGYISVVSLEISPDGEKVFISSGGTLSEITLDSCDSQKLFIADEEFDVGATINWSSGDFVIEKDDMLWYVPQRENRLEGESVRYLTSGINPAMSPDGQWVSFIRDDGIYVINTGNSSERLLFPRQYSSGYSHTQKFPYPRWSPDSNYIVFHDCKTDFCSSKPEEYQIYQLNIETLELIHITSGGLFPYWHLEETK